MGDENFELGPGDLLFGDERIRVDAGELTVTTEEECDDTAFPLKLTNVELECELTATLSDRVVKDFAMLRIWLAPNNWRKMHGYPMRRRRRFKWMK